MLVRGSLAVHLHQQRCPRGRPSPALLATRPLADPPPGHAHTRRRLPPRRQRTTVPGVQRLPGAVLILVLLHRYRSSVPLRWAWLTGVGQRKQPVRSWSTRPRWHSPPQRIDRSNGELLPSRRGRTGLTARLTLRCGLGTQWWGRWARARPCPRLPRLSTARADRSQVAIVRRRSSLPCHPARTGRDGRLHRPLLVMSHATHPGVTSWATAVHLPLRNLPSPTRSP